MLTELERADIGGAVAVGEVLTVLDVGLAAACGHATGVAQKGLGGAVGGEYTHAVGFGKVVGAGAGSWCAPGSTLGGEGGEFANFITLVGEELPNEVLPGEERLTQEASSGYRYRPLCR